MRLTHHAHVASPTQLRFHADTVRSILARDYRPPNFTIIAGRRTTEASFSLSRIRQRCLKTSRDRLMFTSMTIAFGAPCACSRHNRCPRDLAKIVQQGEIFGEESNENVVPLPSWKPQYNLVIFY
ncbi:uncharacterized protein LOC143214942 [Lasioglossum baleicum]|uniref:uncharacterized protein LOC143214942 n=1 Tax=Lasioglossum baleicum TaxID=434251 RepID=UPI003FCD1E6F